jgi:hypothetical protein
VINYPHPLLQRGLVVIDTPGLNAVGAEPELTLGLLPAAHAIVFLLAADTGVSRSDLAIWTEHLGEEALERFVVLNKIDILADPLSTPAAVSAQTRRAARRSRRRWACRWRGSTRCRRATRWRRASTATGRTERSGLPALESALAPNCCRASANCWRRGTRHPGHAAQAATRRLGDLRRHNAEQMLELRGLRGKSARQGRQMLSAWMPRSAISSAALRGCGAAFGAGCKQLQRRWARCPATAARRGGGDAHGDGGHAAAPGRAQGLRALCQRLRRPLAVGRAAHADEMQQMLGASYRSSMPSSASPSRWPARRTSRASSPSWT